MLEDNPTNNSFVCLAHIVRMGFNRLKTFDIKPILSFGFCFPAMNMNRFVLLVRIKKNLQPRIIRIGGIELQLQFDTNYTIY